MPSPITDLMEDLFSVAPELRERREEVQAAIEKMIAARPMAELNAAFKAELRDRLIKEFAGLRSIEKKKSSFSFPSKLSKPAMAIGGLLGLVIVITLVMRGTGTKPAAMLAPQDATKTPVTLALGGEVKHVGANAFGQLTIGTPDNSAPSGASNAQTKSTGATAPSLGSEAATARPMMAPPPVSLDAGTTSTASTMMIAPGMPIRYQPVRQEYHYAGDLALPTAPVEVLKVDHTVDTKNVTAKLASLNLGLIDLGRFEQAQTQNLNLVEDRDFGYTVNVDFQNGTANIGQNWQKWPNNPTPAPLTMGDVPPDNEVIAVAAVFVRDYGIDVSKYGEPVVDKSWVRYAQPMAAVDVSAGATTNSATPTAILYVPDRVTVRYPLLVAGRPVYDQGGSPIGMNVSVDVRLKKVTDAGPIALQNYLASAYEPITDQTKVMETIAAGGLNHWVDQTAEKVYTHTLDAPQEVYIQVWNYSEGGSAQYLVPAWLFRVKDAGASMPNGEWFQDTVIVPLAKDFYTEAPGPILYMKEGGGTSGSAGSGVIVPAPAPPTTDLPKR